MDSSVAQPPEDTEETLSERILAEEHRWQWVAYNGQLYVATSGAAVREWPRNVARDPHVRLKVGNDLYDRTLTVVTDPAEREGVLQARAKKYAQKYPPEGQTFAVYHVMPS